MVNRTTRKSHAILALINELLPVLLVVEVLALITVVMFTVYTRPPIKQHTYILAIMHKQTRAMIRLVHQQRKNMFKKHIKLFYTSLRTYRRKNHRNQICNGEDMMKMGYGWQFRKYCELFPY
jgi:hypothetical protein